MLKRSPAKVMEQGSPGPTRPEGGGGHAAHKTREVAHRNTRHALMQPTQQPQPHAP